MIDEKVLIERLADAGGCDAKEDYFKGWDDAIGEAIAIVNQLAEESKKELKNGRMTAQEAIETIRRQICNSERYCRDNCMHGVEYCAYSMAINALETEIPRKLDCQ